MKIYATVSVFKNKNYIIFHKVNIDNRWITQNSTDIHPVENEEYGLGLSVLSALDKSEKGILNDSNENYWETLGFKTFASFSKNHDLVNILKFNNFYQITRWKKDRGGYIPDSNIESIELPLNATAKEIEDGIKRLLEVRLEETEICSLETLNDSRVEYKVLDFSNYIDKGDAHTDAYQIYVHEEYENNYIGFMIDEGYENQSNTSVKKLWGKLFRDSLSEKIKKIWTRWYGTLKSYEYKEIKNKAYYVQIIGKTNKIERHSYLFKDGENFLELTFQIDLVDTPLDLQEMIRKDFIELAESVKIYH